MAAFITIFSICLLLGANSLAQTKPIARQVAKFKDWNISFAVRGEGDDTLILIHGWGADSSTWSSQLESLKFDGRVVAIDLIGHGQSDKPKMDYTLSTLSQSVLAVMDHLAVKSAILMGHSNGVPVCRDILESHPSRVSALVVVDGPFRSVIPETMAKEMAKRMETSGYKPLAQQMRNFLKPVHELTEKQIDEVVAALENTPAHVLQGTFQAQFAPGFYKKTKVKVPTLMIYAQNKMWSAWDEDYEKYVRELVPDLEYQCWDASHMLHLEHATRFNQVVMDFISKTEKKRTSKAKGGGSQKQMQHPNHRFDANKKEFSADTIRTNIRISPILLVEEIETCLPFWKDGLGFLDHVVVDGASGLDFVELRLEAQSIMFQSRRSVERDGDIRNIRAKPLTKDGTLLYVHLQEPIDTVLARLKEFEVVLKKRTTDYGLEEIGLLAPSKILVVLSAPSQTTPKQ